MISVTTNLDYLIDHLRVHLHDIDPASYEYSMVYLRTALVYAFKALGHRWNHRYIINSNYVVSRNLTKGYVFAYASPPVIQAPDEIIIVLQASIMIKMGRNRTSAANVGSWKDSEVSYSNIAASKAMSDDLRMDLEWLNSLLPKKRLYGADKQALPGFEDNPYEDVPGLE